MPYQLINILDKRKYKLLCSDMYDSDIFKMIPFNSIELELLKRYYCNKYMSTIQYANRQNINRIYNRANIYQDVLLRIEEGKAYEKDDSFREDDAIKKLYDEVAVKNLEYSLILNRIYFKYFNRLY